MLSLTQILAEYPLHLRAHRSSILKEYLQYKILRSIFESKYALKLAFLGGTALRILFNSSRFSEDLDFDNFALNAAEFGSLAKIIQQDLELEGLVVEIKFKTQNAYRLKIRIPKLLFESGLTNLPEQKILLQIDTVPQNFAYTPTKPLLNKFEVFTQIQATPKAILLAQKIYAAVNRPRLMGRDFFDVVFLFSLGVRPDFVFLEQKLGLKNSAELKKYLLAKTADLNFANLAQDVAPFLFDPREQNKVLLFREFVRQSF